MLLYFSAKRKKRRKYTYDANGNQTGWTNDNNGTRRGILWDEENRMRAIADNGVTHHYIYDASGERVIKSNGDGQAIYVNGFPMGGSGTVGNYTMYVNPFLVVQNSKYTKHFYIEGQRIVSKIGASSQAQFVKSTHAGDSIVNPVQWDKKKEHSKDIIIANFEALGLDGAVFTAGKSGKIPYGQIKKYLNSGGSVINPGGGGRSSTPGKIAENLQFYYHPDHLGSSNYITDATGEVYQHQEYFPFGETFVEERNSAEYTTYLFNGKELDEETGLYYYGARYYDPRISIWLSVDPMAEISRRSSPFAYCDDNPIRFIDPDGMTKKEREDAADRMNEHVKKGTKYGSHDSNVKPGGTSDCVGTVSESIVYSGVKDPNHGPKGSTGVNNVMRNTKRIENQDAERGNLAVTHNGGHVVMIDKVIYNDEGKATKYLITHNESKYSYEDGNGNTIEKGGKAGFNEIRLDMIGKSEGNYLERNFVGVYKWDADELVNYTAGTLKEVIITAESNKKMDIKVPHIAPETSNIIK